MREGHPIIPVFILDDEGERPWAPGAASRWWLHHSLDSLAQELKKRGSRLVLARGDSGEILRSLAREAKARAIFWNTRYEPLVLRRDRQLAQELEKEGLTISTFNSSLLFEPGSVLNKQGKPFQVFTPFWKSCVTRKAPAPVRLPAASLRAPTAWPRSLALKALALLPRIPWDKGFYEVWQPGEPAALQALQHTVRQIIRNYPNSRNLPSHRGTSRLSPHLHFGEIGPRQIWSALQRKPLGASTTIFQAELGWREFAHQLLYHFPRTPTDPLHEEYARFPWAKDPGQRRLQAWQKGQTGYPIVDAGLREIWRTGWMHNRVRMIVASFLVKHLRLDWYQGARWFWDTLVDADLSNNTLGWQWSAGCGADAAPYFRIFSPMRQGAKFDPDGAYVRKWVPELAQLSRRYLHQPWTAPEAELRRAKLELGRDYPRPLVTHETARKEALEAFHHLRSVRG